MVQPYQKLSAWNSSIDLVVNIYHLTRSFPKEELYCLTNQLRRAAISISSNIAEGHQRGSNKEFIRFLYIAKGSEAELQTQLLIALKLGYITEDDYGNIIMQCNRVGAMIHNLIKSITI